MITPDEAFAVMQQRLERWGRIDGNRVVFIPDESLKYRRGQTVLGQRENAFTIADASRWAKYLDDGQSWLHANLLVTRQHDPVISLRRGPSVNKVSTGPDGLPFSINVSVEPALLEWAPEPGLSSKDLLETD